MNAWWLCPNEPRCPHGAALHDVYDYDDPRPTCCAEGCDCGKPEPPTRRTEQDGGIPNDAITRADWEAARAPSSPRSPTGGDTQDTTGETRG